MCVYASFYGRSFQVWLSRIAHFNRLFTLVLPFPYFKHMSRTYDISFSAVRICDFSSPNSVSSSNESQPFTQFSAILRRRNFAFKFSACLESRQKSDGELLYLKNNRTML